MSAPFGECIGNYALTVKVHRQREACFGGHTFRSPVWGEFISILKEVIGMATREDKSRAVLRSYSQ
jgi:hypothetical protein